MYSEFYTRWLNPPVYTTSAHSKHHTPTQPNPSGPPRSEKSLDKKKVSTYTDYLYDVGYNSPYPSGVYCLVDVVVGKVYVGSTINFTQRSAQHFKALEEGIHHNRDLQYAFDQDGPAGFSFIVLEYVPDVDRLEEAEQKWLNRLLERSYNRQVRIQRDDEAELIQPNKVLPWEEA